LIKDLRSAIRSAGSEPVVTLIVIKPIRADKATSRTASPTTTRAASSIQRLRESHLEEHRMVTAILPAPLCSTMRSTNTRETGQKYGSVTNEVRAAEQLVSSKGYT